MPAPKAITNLDKVCPCFFIKKKATPAKIILIPKNAQKVILELKH